MSRLYHILDRIAETRITGPDASKAVAVSLTSGTEWTPSSSGWLVLNLAVSGTQTLQPVAALQQGTGNVVAYAQGLARDGTSFQLTCPVQEGIPYIPTWYRCNLSGAKLYANT